MTGVIMLFMSAVANAGTLYTPAISLGSSGPYEIRCFALNPSKKPNSFTVEIFNPATGAQTGPTETCDAEEGRGCGATAFTTFAQVYCRVGFKGSKKSVRASISLIDSSTGFPVISFEAR
jgi:hypothetical protein